MTVPGVRRYAAWQALIGTWFWIPVFFLYFTGELGLDGALLLEAVYYVAVVVTEVPSGYLSDRVGRRATLVMASVWFVLAYIAFMVGGSLGMLLVGQVCLALGISFRSGTDTSYHLELLTGAGAQAEYRQREARLGRLVLLGGAVGALAGGVLGAVDFRWAYALCVAGAVGALMVSLTFRPTPAAPAAPGPVTQLRDCLRASVNPASAGRPRLGWLFAVAVLAVVLAHVPYQLYQPYLDLLRFSQDGISTPTLSGVHAAVAMVIAAPVAGWSARVASRFGVRWTLLLALAAQLAVIGAMAVAVHPAIAVVLLFRGAPGALMRAPLEAAVAPQLAARLRATYLSVQSLGGRLAYAAVLAVMSVSVGDGASPQALRWLAGSVVAVGAIAWIVLALTGRGGQHRADSTAEAQ